MLSASLLLFACNNSPKVVTYQDAERQFRSTLTNEDTLEVRILAQEFMERLAAGNPAGAVDLLYVVTGSVLTKVQEPEASKLARRYGAPVTEWMVDKCEFSTQANNTYVCRYTVGDKELSDSGLKFVFCPIKIGEDWYLTLKEGPATVHPLAPAPYPVRLAAKEEN